MAEIELRCMAEGRADSWLAVCVDLDIAVQGESFPEVRESLAKAIDMYLDRVGELPSAEQQQLINRRSPWHVRAKFEFYRVLSKFKRDGGHRPFTLPGHAPA